MLSVFEEIRRPAVGFSAVAGPPVVHVWLLTLQVAGRDRPARGQTRQQALDDVERDVRDGEIRLRQRVCECVGAMHGELDAVHTCVLPGRVDRRLVEIDADDGREAELGGRDREHPRAAADVEQAPRLELLQQLEAEARRRVRARAERATRIDHDRLRARRCLLPRWTDPEPAADDAVVEGAPRVLPALGDRLGHNAEARAKSALAGLVRVDGEAAGDLLDALREELEQECELRLAAGDDDPSQRNALLIFSKTPSSSGLYVLSSACASNSASRRRCSSLRWRGTTTLTSTR